ncbi:MAG: hypothetical protein RMK73_06040 [Geminicoccaceae bacterium]|nr:hypothetical protein [Geminicoccaceae bacterium]MDW8341025.1 hypothetical protein [Geminicoccaceae bacterium]
MTALPARASATRGWRIERGGRRGIDRLTRDTLRRLEAEAGGPVATAAALRTLRAGPMALPGLALLWGPSIRIATANGNTTLPRELERRFCLYAIEVDGRPVYIGMAAGATVAQRLRAHLALARRPGTAFSRRGDLARLHSILVAARANRKSIAARIGVVSDWGPYRRDRKVLHAAEALAANLLLAGTPDTVAYDPSTWTFETPNCLGRRRA